jgi:serine/threonine protein phosphatase PrpC
VSVSTPRHVVWAAPAESPAGARDAAACSQRSAQGIAQGTAQGIAQGTEWADAQFSAGGMHLRAAVASSRGPIHAVNEDSHSPIDGVPVLFVVADGVGGGASASYVSKELVSRLHCALAGRRHDAEAVRAALLDADRAIASALASRTDEPGAATVALCARTGASPSHWLIAWVGDCRIYRIPAMGPIGDADAELLTVDDTYRNLGETPPPGGSLDDPSRMVGNGAVDAPNVRFVKLGVGEMLVLCSDGVHKYVDARDIVRSLAEPLPLARRCINLIEHARTRGSHDDATVLSVQREDRGIGRLARVMATSVLIAFLALIAMFLVGDRAAAQRQVLHDAFSQSGGQP